MFFVSKLTVSLYPQVTATPKLQQVCSLKVAYVKVVLQYHIIICEPNLTPAKFSGLRRFQLTNFQTYTNRRLIDLGGVNLTATPIFD